MLISRCDYANKPILLTFYRHFTHFYIYYITDYPLKKAHFTHFLGGILLTSVYRLMVSSILLTLKSILLTSRDNRFTL